MRVILFLLLFYYSLTLYSQESVFQRQEKFYYAVKNGEWTKAESWANDFAGLSEEYLLSQLDTKPKKLAFWLNAYNIYILYFLKQDPSLFEDRDSFFKKERFVIAGEDLSFDEVEHGIIRSSKNKYSLGYLGKLFVNDFEESFRLEKVDYRIHFALNCGAASCPPVTLYDFHSLDVQLNQSSLNYLESTVTLNENNELYVPVLAFWFNADFGGEDGIRKMLRKFGFSKLLQNGPNIKYLDYNWDLQLDNFKD